MRQCDEDYQPKVELTDNEDNYFLGGKRRKRINGDEQKRKRKYNHDRTWPCRKCGAVLQTRRLLRTHKLELHKDDEIVEHTYKFDEFQDLYICSTCSAEYQKKEEVENHLKIHKEVYQCTVCQETFQKVYHYGIHLALHSTDNLYPCPLCPFKTKTKPSLLTHINLVHLKKFYHFCTTCGRGFNDIILYKEHHNEHLGVKPFICVVCKKAFTYSRYLLTHQMRYHRVGIDGKYHPNQCSYCNKIFSKTDTLKRHVEVRHSKKPVPREKKHLCDHCGKGFAQKNKLQVHYRVHTGDKPYVCSYCPKSFTKKDYLTMHERVHSGEKPYSCEYCGKCFNQGAPLRIHLRSHTGERPYVCNFCNSGFTSKGALNNHCKSCSGMP